MEIQVTNFHIEVSLDMKTIISFTIGFFILTSCFNKHVYDSYKHQKHFVNQTNPRDSITETGINEYQRAFAIYLMSLSEEERQEWVSSAFTEEEVYQFLDTIKANGGTEIKLK